MKYSFPDSNGIINQIWLIRNHLGNLHYFYGDGEKGFKFYVAVNSAIYFEDADKIADTRTDFLDKGIEANLSGHPEPGGVFYKHRTFPAFG